MSRLIGVIVFVILPMAVQAAPIDTALAAFAAEEAAQVERVRLFIQRGDISDVYYIDRARPGRFRMAKNPDQNGPQMVIIDGDQWVKSGATWRKSPAPAAAGLIPSMAGMLREGLSDAVERPDGGGRLVEGRMTWTNAVVCDGRLVVRINAAGLPTQLRFDGSCNGKPSHFHQAFSYEGPIAILPPASDN